MTKWFPGFFSAFSWLFSSLTVWYRRLSSTLRWWGRYECSVQWKKSKIVAKTEKDLKFRHIKSILEALHHTGCVPSYRQPITLNNLSQVLNAIFKAELFLQSHPRTRAIGNWTKNVCIWSIILWIAFKRWQYSVSTRSSTQSQTYAV